MILDLLLIFIKITFYKNFNKIFSSKFKFSNTESKVFAETSIVLFFALCFIAGNLTAQKKDKLIVGIVVDQMCYEYLYRYYDKFGDDGFKKIMKKGTNCRNTNYNYLPTFTGPGHASIYTGTTPNNNGIVANDWLDRNTGLEMNCVGDSSVNSVGTTSDEGQCSPINLKANTITDNLKLTYPNAKVISMSIKNRGAILPGGHLSDGSYWYDYATGKFITSSFFKSQLPNWVNSFNNEKQPFKIKGYLNSNSLVSKPNSKSQLKIWN